MSFKVILDAIGMLLIIFALIMIIILRFKANESIANAYYEIIKDEESEGTES